MKNQLPNEITFTTIHSPCVWVNSAVCVKCELKPCLLGPTSHLYPCSFLKQIRIHSRSGSSRALPPNTPLPANVVGCSHFTSLAVCAPRLPPENWAKTCSPVIWRTGMKRYLFIKQRVGFGRKGWLRGCWMGSGVAHPRGSPALRQRRIPMRKIMCPCECQSSVSWWWESMFSVSCRHNKPD